MKILSVLISVILIVGCQCTNACHELSDDFRILLERFRSASDANDQQLVAAAISDHFKNNDSQNYFVVSISDKNGQQVDFNHLGAYVDSYGTTPLIIQLYGKDKGSFFSVETPLLDVGTVSVLTRE